MNDHGEHESPELERAERQSEPSSWPPAATRTDSVMPPTPATERGPRMGWMRALPYSGAHADAVQRMLALQQGRLPFRLLP